jgi:uncharacterized protein (TIGR02147 family)
MTAQMPKLNQPLFQDLLNESYLERKAKNPSFSIRAFSQRLGINHSAVSEIMNGKRKVGPKLGVRIANALMADSDLMKKLFMRESTRDERKPEIKSATLLKADQYRLISDWHHFAILSLLDTDSCKHDVAWIAKRLGLNKKEAAAAIQRMIRLGLIRLSGKKLSLTGQSFTSPDGTIDAAVRRTHFQYLEMAHRSLDTDPIEKRDFTAITMAIDPKKLPEARKRIRAFRDELCAFLESDEKKEVYELCFQLFPLSKEV